MNIQITNGKALYEGLEIENDLTVFMLLSNNEYEDIKDGTYPLPEGWGVVKKEIPEPVVCRDNLIPCREPSSYNCPCSIDMKQWESKKQTARLVRKEQSICPACDNKKPNHNCACCHGAGVIEEQNSAHGYSEGSEIGPLNNKKLSLDLRISPTKGELRKEFKKFLNDEWPVREDCYPEIILRFFEPIIQERDREIAAQKQLTKDEVKRVSDIYQSVIDELKKKYELP